MVRQLRQARHPIFSGFLFSLSPIGRSAGVAALAVTNNGAKRGIISECKRLVRPEWSLSQWSEHKLCNKQWPLPREDMDKIEVLPLPSAQSIDLMNPGRFSHNLDETWPDADAFSLQRLQSDYGAQEFSIGTEDETGDDVTLTLDDYLSYASIDRDSDGDDSPLYIFDDWILSPDGDDDDCCPLANAYSIPRCFPHDFMAEMGMDHRPPFCWLLIGAPRSGTAMHIDPTHTAAWNTLVSGKKRWILFPPICQDGAAADQNDNPEYNVIDDDDELYGDSVNHWIHDKYKTATIPDKGIDFVQMPGETVYVPNGWRHAVINLELSVAVTHNFVGPHNVQLALKSMKQSDDLDLALEWEERLRQKGLLL